MSTRRRLDRNNVMVCEPDTELWRVGRSTGPMYFSRIASENAEDDRAGNRFDVLGGGVLYAAAEPVGAYTETLQGFRPSTATRAAAQEHQPGLMLAGDVPRDWREKRSLAQFLVQSATPFVDVESPQTHRALEHHLASELAGLGVANLDISAVRSERRLLTRLIATWVYRAADPNTDYAMYCGIRYVSKIGNQECWAVFEGTELSLLGATPIDGNDRAYRQAGGQLGLRLH
ncbi:RES domain-containing protein [Kocuria sp. M1R5S2]|uniref:RES domain-containing protein n=1 Tax=Kocuria rhizosphaerae TaxID=3376285 RepID=UPI0037A469FD